MTDRSPTCLHLIPAPNLQTFPSDSLQPACRSTQKTDHRVVLSTTSSCPHFHHSTPFCTACIFTSGEVSTQITFTKAALCFDRWILLQNPSEKQEKERRLFRTLRNGDRSGLWPVAARTAGVKDKPGLAVLLVRDSIQTVPKGIPVVCHRVEAVRFVSTEASAPTSGPTSTSTSAPTGGRKSCWCDGLRGGSATWKDI